MKENPEKNKVDSHPCATLFLKQQNVYPILIELLIYKVPVRINHCICVMCYLYVLLCHVVLLCNHCCFNHNSQNTLFAKIIKLNNVHLIFNHISKSSLAGIIVFTNPQNALSQPDYCVFPFTPMNKRNKKKRNRVTRNDISKPRDVLFPTFRSTVGLHV